MREKQVERASSTSQSELLWSCRKGLEFIRWMYLTFPVPFSSYCIWNTLEWCKIWSQVWQSEESEKENTWNSKKFHCICGWPWPVKVATHCRTESKTRETNSDSFTDGSQKFSLRRLCSPAANVSLISSEISYRCSQEQEIFISNWYGGNKNFRPLRRSYISYLCLLHYLYCTSQQVNSVKLYSGAERGQVTCQAFAMEQA